ncbi:MAG: polysaccharide biosynthesis protein, partial [Pseudomonadota bacterium]
MSRFQSLAAKLILDALLTVLCLYLAFLIRFEFTIPNDAWAIFFSLWPWVLVAKMAIYAAFGLYRAAWRYTSLVDLINVGKAVLTASLLVIIGILM